jgi:hypothetical protein
MAMVPDEDELMPTTSAPVVVDTAESEPVPVAAPMVLPVTVPMLALPEVTLMPHSTPLVVVAPLDVVRLMAETVLPCTELGETVPTAKLIPIKRVAMVPSIVYVPVPAELAKPITLLLTV